MSNVNFFPELQEIARDLRHINSALSFRYSDSVVTVRSAVSNSEQQRTHLLLILFVFSLIIGIALYTQNYFFLIIAAASAIWQWRSYARKKHDIKALRFENEVVVDNATEQICVEHLHPYYREQVASASTFAFNEIRAVRVRQRRVNSDSSQHTKYYGQLYFTLADETDFFLLEVEDERIANNMARALQFLLGLPMQLRQEKPWYTI
jgi:hypothetical protein